MILQGYVGKDLREAVLDYGYPVMFLDMADGRRAFQWDMSRKVDLPASAETTTKTQGLWTNSTTSTSKTVIDPGGTMTITNCKYTMFGEWSTEQNGWEIVDFKKPSGICALP
jgi:hypothetical protein